MTATTLEGLLAEQRGLDIVTAGLTIREGTDGTPTFFGHAAVFDARTAIGSPLTWGFYEEVARGAFTKTLAEGDARFLVDHDTSLVVSRVSAGTLSLEEDTVGLAVDSALNQRKSYVADLVENVRDKSITGMSFGFYVVKDEWSSLSVELADGNTADVELRRILEVRLLEVSAVTFPAYEETDAGLRSAGVSGRELRDVAAALVRRGDADALERRAALRPELTDFRHLIREPAETTRDEDQQPAAPTADPDTVAMKMRGYASRYGLPAKG